MASIVGEIAFQTRDCRILPHVSSNWDSKPYVLTTKPTSKKKNKPFMYITKR